MVHDGAVGIQTVESVHFVGVGGAGMSALALVLHARGVSVTGSDLKDSRFVRTLRGQGIEVVLGHDPANVGSPDVVVVSTAIPDTNPEVAAARERGIPVWPRAEMLAYLAGERTTIAVAGTHGKTSTSSMALWTLREMGQDPSFCIGGIVDGIDTNAGHGGGVHYVVEADESDGSFVYLAPDVAIVTNLEADHLDHYGSIEEIEAVFVDFLHRLKPGGVAVVCGDDARLLRVVRSADVPFVTYGSGAECNFRYQVTGRRGIGSTFSVSLPDGVTIDCSVAVPGEHMVSNATAVLAALVSAGLDASGAAVALATYSGVRRRFDLVGEAGGVTIVDDYGHHPTEVAATLGAACGLGYARTVVLFQPHRYTRTAAFAEDFGAAFDCADLVCLMEVYSAGEAPIPGVGGRTIVDAVLTRNPRAQVAFLPHRDEAISYLTSVVRPGDLVLTMGAGDVTSIGPDLLAAIGS